MLIKLAKPIKPTNQSKSSSIELESLTLTVSSNLSLRFTKMGASSHNSDLIDCSSGSSKKQLQTVEVKVRMDCCEACVKKVRKAVKGMEGVNSVEIEREANKLTVTGYVEPSDVVSRIAHRTGNKAEILSYVSYEDVGGIRQRSCPMFHTKTPCPTSCPASLVQRHRSGPVFHTTMSLVIYIYLSVLLFYFL
ncbi:heavy metal-associated isoprenylated plant protein 26-like [Lotus japonicus]|uniref:heavy metal-associated isoprenylated plant protein 26-like n=1 Tax=Lotus japonicus TaxID=34305 RepID=UPI002585561A|nr:heavy metal-associated isoprenylated plant protein 26-like [Lotus japonicus]